MTSHQTVPVRKQPARGRNMSIRTRLTLIIIGLALGCLLVGFAVVGVRQIDSLRAQRLRSMSTLADVVGDSSVSGLAFDDKDDTADVLARLRRFSDIEVAVVFDVEGKVFASYRRDGASIDVSAAAPLARGARPVREVKDSISMVRMPIDYEGEHYGTVELIQSNRALAAEIRALVLTLVAIAAALLVAAMFVGWFLQRRITRPILQLADVARQITEGGTPSLRAATGQPGEISTLAAGFNAMLEELEAREREIMRSRDMLRAVIDASPVAIIGVDADRKVMLWSERASAYFGTPEADAVGQPIARVAIDPALASVWTPWPGPVERKEVELDTGRMLAISIESVPDGGAVVMAADITEERHAAHALAERAAQLQRAQKMDVVGRLAGGVAHDFNNLLTVILASCQMLARRSSTRPELQGYVDNIQSAAQRGAALSRRLLGFSRRQASDQRVVDIKGVVNDLEKMVRSITGENVTVAKDLAAGPSTAHIDQGQLEQVLLNLVINARDAMQSGGVMTLRTRLDPDGDTGPEDVRSPTGGWIAVSVEDTGVGMPPETLNRLYEPFFTTKSNGTGLGLSTARQIVRDMGGDITVQTRLGRGTTFTVWLPLLDGTADRSTELAAVPLVTTSDTILLVEDEVALRNLVQILLTEAGYHVIPASTSREALALGMAPGVAVDLLLTDVVMPGLSGPQLANELTRRRPEVQVLYMSGYVGDALAEQGLDESTVTIISKPFKPEQLLRLVRDMLDARTLPRAHRNSSTDFSLKDPAKA
jgi:two-component system cell cycle sensor histidine kinase/response regulator CckA